MKCLTSFLLAIFTIVSISGIAQVESFDELEFEMDSISMPYKAAGKNFVFLRSKRGSSGLNKTASADAILTAEVTEIVLVYTEQNAAALAEREEANRERWENLIKTYPELFQYSTTYKSICQCNESGDGEMFKQKQGFYVYINGEVPKVEEPAVAAVTTYAKQTEPAKTEPVADKKPAAKIDPLPEIAIAVPDNTSVKTKEPAVAEKTVAEPESIAVTKTAETTEEEVPEEPAKTAVKEKPKTKVAAAGKARRSKDPKACRIPCYGYGDEDLNAFFKDNITLSKKEKRKAKNWVANVRLQIHFDGSIKKVMVTGSNEDFNQKVQDVLKTMNRWNSAVKNGLAVKSDVKFVLRYDKESKAMKPGEFMINPRLAPKCRCMTDDELFGD